MAEVGEVVEVKGKDVKVRLLRKEACAKCGACTAGLKSEDMFIDALNVAHAQKGDWVEIKLNEQNFLKAVGIMYVIPLAGLLAGLGLGALVGKLFLPSLADVLAIVLGLAGAGLSFLMIHLNEDKFKTDKFKPKAVKVTDKNRADCS